MKKIDYVIDLLIENKLVLMVALFISTISIIVFIANLSNPNLNDILSSSINTPWGIVTSIFVHVNFIHLGLNIFFLWLWNSFIIIQESLLDRFERIKRLKFFVVTIFVAAIIPNAIWVFVLFPGSRTMGSSGVVFAILGGTVGFYLMNIVNIISKFKIQNQQIIKRRKIKSLLFNTIVLVFFLALIFYSPFFDATDPKVNVFVHAMSFLIAFLLVMVREYIPILKAMIQDLRHC